MCGCMHVSVGAHSGQKGALSSTGAVVYRLSWAACCGCWEPSSCPLCKSSTYKSKLLKTTKVFFFFLMPHALGWQGWELRGQALSLLWYWANQVATVSVIVGCYSKEKEKKSCPGLEFLSRRDTPRSHGRNYTYPKQGLEGKRDYRSRGRLPMPSLCPILEPQYLLSNVFWLRYCRLKSPARN